LKVTDAIKTVRKRVNDEYESGYSDDVLLGYINDALSYLGSALVSILNPSMIKEIVINEAEIPAESTTKLIPKNFVKTAGKYPIRITGNTFEIMDGSKQIRIRYFATFDTVTYDDEFPFANALYDTVVIKLACIYALNQHEFDTAQDQALTEQLNSIIVSMLNG
jgi:hypothetical protein